MICNRSSRWGQLPFLLPDKRDFRYRNCRAAVTTVYVKIWTLGLVQAGELLYGYFRWLKIEPVPVGHQSPHRTKAHSASEVKSATFAPIQFTSTDTSTRNRSQVDFQSAPFILQDSLFCMLLWHINHDDMIFDEWMMNDFFVGTKFQISSLNTSQFLLEDDLF